MQPILKCDIQRCSVTSNGNSVCMVIIKNGKLVINNWVVRVKNAKLAPLLIKRIIKMIKQYLSVFLACWVLLTTANLSNANETTFSEIEVAVNHQRYPLEYAETFEQRAQGLMFRQSLCDDCGMLFKFESERRAGMWMKNTFIALDVAFIAANGTITDIKSMQPHDVNTTSASQPVLYAWEMNRGWFAKHQIKVGDVVQLAKAGE